MLFIDVCLTDGTDMKVDNPSNMPDAQKIDRVEEPYVKASMMVPKIMLERLWNFVKINVVISLIWNI